VNERIDKLLVKAGAYFGGEGVEYSNFDPKKFAELIIQECIEAVENTPTHCAYTTFQLGIVECTIDKSVETLYNHFNKQRTYKVEAPL